MSEAGDLGRSLERRRESRFSPGDFLAFLICLSGVSSKLCAAASPDASADLRSRAMRSDACRIQGFEFGCLAGRMQATLGFGIRSGRPPDSIAWISFRCGITQHSQIAPIALCSNATHCRSEEMAPEESASSVYQPQAVLADGLASGSLCVGSSTSPTQLQDWYAIEHKQNLGLAHKSQGNSYNQNDGCTYAHDSHILYNNTLCLPSGICPTGIGHNNSNKYYHAGCGRKVYGHNTYACNGSYRRRLDMSLRTTAINHKSYCHRRRQCLHYCSGPNGHYKWDPLPFAMSQGSSFLHWLWWTGWQQTRDCDALRGDRRLAAARSSCGPVGTTGPRAVDCSEVLSFRALRGCGPVHRGALGHTGEGRSGKYLEVYTSPRHESRDCWGQRLSTWLLGRGLSHEVVASEFEWLTAIIADWGLLIFAALSILLSLALIVGIFSCLLSAFLQQIELALCGLCLILISVWYGCLIFRRAVQFSLRAAIHLGWGFLRLLGRVTKCFLFILKRRYSILLMVGVACGVHCGADAVAVERQLARRRYRTTGRDGRDQCLRYLPRVWPLTCGPVLGVGTLGRGDVNRGDVNKPDNFLGRYDYLSGVPVGQARVPGPPASSPGDAYLDPCVSFDHRNADASGLGLDVVSRNIGCLRHKLHLVMCLGHDAVLLQEVDVDECHVRELQSEAFVSGYALRWGSPTSLDKTGTRIGRRVAILIKQTLFDFACNEDVDDPKLDGTVSYLQASGRWAEASINIGNGCKLFLATLYGVSGASSCPAKRELTQRLHAAAISRVKALGSAPYLIGADSNILPEALPAVQQARIKGMVTDILVEAYPGCEVPNTFAKNGAYPGMTGENVSRIDAFFANSAALALVESISLKFSQTAGYDHVPLQLRLNSALTKQVIDIAVQPRRLKLPDLGSMSSKQRQELHERLDISFKAFVTGKEQEYRALLDQNAIDDAHKWWCDLVEAWLIHNFADAADFRMCPPPRGRALPIRSVPVVSQWSARLQHTRERADARGSRLVGAVRDLRARLKRWTKMLPSGGGDDEMVVFCETYGIDRGLFAQVKPADEHCAAATLKTIHQLQHDFLAEDVDDDVGPDDCHNAQSTAARQNAGGRALSSAGRHESKPGAESSRALWANFHSCWGEGRRLVEAVGGVGWCSPCFSQ